jgi:hypothetical protein
MDFRQPAVKGEATEVNANQQFFSLLNLMLMFLCGWTLNIATGYLMTITGYQMGSTTLFGYLVGMSLISLIVIYLKITKVIRNYTRLLIFNAAIAILIPALLFGAALSFWYTGPITMPRHAHK